MSGMKCRFWIVALFLLGACHDSKAVPANGKVGDLPARTNLDQIPEKLRGCWQYDQDDDEIQDLHVRLEVGARDLVQTGIGDSLIAKAESMTLGASSKGENRFVIVGPWRGSSQFGPATVATQLEFDSDGLAMRLREGDAGSYDYVRCKN